MTKKQFFIFIFMVITIWSIIAQEKIGYIKPTFSLGYSSFDIIIEKENLFTVGVDVDFVSKLGLTFGLKNITAFNSDHSLFIFPIGIGYTYDDKFDYINENDRRPSFGFKLIGVPYMNKPAIGFDIHAVFWLSEKTGISILFDIYFMKDTNYAALSARLGYTMRL